MAFVFRSSKNLEEQIKTQNNIFPVNVPYFSDEPEITKKYFSKNNIIKSMAPFGVKALKESSYQKDNSNNPGPGTYHLPENILKKSFNQNLTSPSDPENIEGSPAQLFISKERRFKNMYKDNKENINQSLSDYNYEKNKILKYSEKKAYPQYPKPKKYKIFDPNRQISIPSDDFYYQINSKGEVEVRQNNKTNNKNWNNTGPGSYDVKFISKNNNSIDLSRTVNDIKKNKNNDNDKLIENKNLKINTQINTFHNFINTESSLNNGGNISTNGMNTNIEKFANKICYTTNLNYVEETKKPKKDKLEIKVEDIPGPGDYDITLFMKTPICFSNVTNFGSNASRGLLYPSKDNKILIGHKDNELLPIIKNNNKSFEHNKSLSLENKEYDINRRRNKHRNKLKLPNDSNKLNSMYINNLKERNLINKKILMTQVGPGSYDPTTSLYKYKKENDIQNFGALDIRFKEDNEKMNNPGVGTYSLEGDLIKKKSMFISPIPSNIIKRNSEGISKDKLQEMKMYLNSERNKQPGAGDYCPELVNSLNYKIYKEAKNSEKKPGFNNGQKRFFEPKNKYEDENHVGKYNILPKEKEFSQQIRPFGSKAERNSFDEERGRNNNIGPAYRYDSYFDWNKKSFNMLFNI